MGGVASVPLEVVWKLSGHHAGRSARLFMKEKQGNLKPCFKLLVCFSCSNVQFSFALAHDSFFRRVGLRASFNVTWSFRTCMCRFVLGSCLLRRVNVMSLHGRAV